MKVTKDEVYTHEENSKKMVISNLLVLYSCKIWSSWIEHKHDYWSLLTNSIEIKIGWQHFVGGIIQILWFIYFVILTRHTLFLVKCIFTNKKRETHIFKYMVCVIEHTVLHTIYPINFWIYNLHTLQYHRWYVANRCHPFYCTIHST